MRPRAATTVCCGSRARLPAIMIEQVFANRQVGEDWDAQRLQQRRGTDAGALQNCGRVNGTGAEDYFVAPAIAEAKCRLAQRPVDISPIRHRRTIDRDRAAIAVIDRIRKILVGLELAEIRQHRLPAPALAALRLPAIEIVGHRADRDLAVDGGTAAHGPAAPRQTRRLPPGSPCQQFRPAKIVVTDRTHRVRDPDVLRRIGGAKILPGLEQQHAV
jgi:hypothetical protein